MITSHKFSTSEVCFALFFLWESQRFSVAAVSCTQEFTRISEKPRDICEHWSARYVVLHRERESVKTISENLKEKKVQDRTLMTSRGSWTEHVTKTYKMACSCIYNGWEKNTTWFKNSKLVYCYSSLKVKSIQIRSDLEYLLISINHRNVIKIDRQAKTLPSNIA